MSLIKELGHVCIITEDLKKTERFYCDVLGLTKAFEFVTKQGHSYGFYLKVGSRTFIEVFEDKEHISLTGPVLHICLEVNDINEIIKTLHHFNIKCTDKELAGDNTWQCWSEDPSGIPIEFFQYTEHSMQFKGGTCIAHWVE